MTDGLTSAPPAFLASVISAQEAEIAIAAGADVIDCKDPNAGALGALDLATIRNIVVQVANRLPVSATVGDVSIDNPQLISLVSDTAATGVDFVKIGLFGNLATTDIAAQLARVAKAERSASHLVAVLMADADLNFDLIGLLAAAGFEVVMLDTADKQAGRLTDVMSETRLAEFVAHAHQHGIAAGLAGSLTREDIPRLAGANPDILGFRGALCAGGRTGALDGARVSDIARAILNTATDPETRERSVA